MLPTLPPTDGTPNPEYNPDWENIFDERKAAYDVISAEMSDFYSKDSGTDEEYTDIKKRLDTADSFYKSAFRMQHPTVQGYAGWLFGSFPIYADSKRTQIIIPDFFTMTTLDEVEQNWRQISELAEKMRPYLHESLPAQTNGIFSNDTVTSYTKSFDQIGQSPSLVTVEQAKNISRVCFMERMPGTGRSVTNSIEQLAGVVYEEARNISKLQGLRNIFAGRAATPSPQQFEFYIHIPPECGIDESFAKIDMVFTQGQFRSPSWTQMDKIPLTVQQARFKDQGIIPTHYRLHSPDGMK